MTLERTRDFKKPTKTYDPDIKTPPRNNKPQITGSILEKLRENEEYNRKNSIVWFESKIKELGRDIVNKNGLIKTTKEIQQSKLFLGSMNFFMYNPKTKATLPFYDRFPLTFVFGVTKTGFIGINFHYLPIPFRIRLYERLWVIAKNSTRNVGQQVFRLNWELLRNFSKFPEVKPCVKQYLFTHVQSRFIRIPIRDWKSALMLPNEEFMKVNSNIVQRLSVTNMVRRDSS